MPLFVLVLRYRSGNFSAVESDFLEARMLFPRSTIRLRHRHDGVQFAQVALVVELVQEKAYRVVSRLAVVSRLGIALRPDPNVFNVLDLHGRDTPVPGAAWEGACISGIHFATRELGLRYPSRGSCQVELLQVTGRLGGMMATTVMANAAALAVAAAVRRQLSLEPDVEREFEVAK